MNKIYQHCVIFLTGASFGYSFWLFSSNDWNSLTDTSKIHKLYDTRSPNNDTDSDSAHTYYPADIESFYMNNLAELGFDTHGGENADTCQSVALNNSSPFYPQLQSFLSELEGYYDTIKNNAPLIGASDLRVEKEISARYGTNPHDVCDRSFNHNFTSDKLQQIFSKSGFLSYSSTAGYMEPILPMARHPRICQDKYKYVMDMEYLVHDFHHMCKQLKPHSKMIFVDMGASLDFHGGGPGRLSPNTYIHTIYSKFGFIFDHIYAYEVTPKEAPKVYELVPDNLISAWHWINVGVDAGPDSRMNPFAMLKSKFKKDDFIVVKLDIDTNSLEVPLVHQLRDDPEIRDIVDQFYFEYHVHQKELEPEWKGGMEGSVKDSMELMTELRKRGVAAHYWP